MPLKGMGLPGLSRAELQRIHTASLQLLEQTGLRIDHAAALDRLADAGAQVDRTTNRVRFPAALVERCLAEVPRTMRLAGREPQFDHVLRCESNFRVRCLSGPNWMLEEKDGALRPATLQDQERLAVVCDALADIDFAGLLSIQDVPPPLADLYAVKTLLQHSRKHFMSLSLGSKNMRYLAEMQLAVCGGRSAMRRRPLFHAIVCPISPLYYPADEIERLLVCAEYKMPVKAAVEIMLGTSAPVTLAGTIAQGNAEVLGALTLMYILYPENPAVYYCFPSVTDMRTGAAVGGGPENMLLYAALSQLGRRCYQLPTEGPGLVADGVDPAQCLFQKGVGALTAAAAGTTLLSGAGGLKRETASGVSQLVIDDEIIRFVRRMAQGFAVSEDKIGLDAVQRTGPQGHYLADNHTMAHFREELQFYASVFDFEAGEERFHDPDRLRQRARAQADKILRIHAVPPLADAVIRELDTILASAQKEIM